MNKKSKFGWIALSIAGGTIGVGIAVKALVTKYGLMKKMMFTARQSKLNFEETISSIRESAVKHGWEIPTIHNLQQEYQAAGLNDMTRMKIIYFCNPYGGYRILKDDQNKSMSVMMPMGVSVYETNDGQVYIAGPNLGLMSTMFAGTVKETFKEGAANFEKTLENIIET